VPFPFLPFDGVFRALKPGPFLQPNAKVQSASLN
jgi:hypothetical protein